MLSLKKSSQNKITDDNRTVSETITDRVHRHLIDQRSVITDDDIRNSRIVLDVVINAYEDFLAQLNPHRPTAH
jgi:hypothetical protein